MTRRRRPRALDRSPSARVTMAARLVACAWIRFDFSRSLPSAPFPFSFGDPNMDTDSRFRFCGHRPSVPFRHIRKRTDSPFRKKRNRTPTLLTLLPPRQVRARFHLRGPVSSRLAMVRYSRGGARGRPG